MLRVRRVRRAAIAAIALGALALGAVAAIDRATGPSMGASIASAASIGIDGTRIGITTLSGGAGPLRDGDVVVAIDGRQVADWSSVGQLTASIGQTVPVRVERDGAALDLGVRLDSYPTASVAVANAGTLAFCIVFALVAAYVFARRPDVPASGALLVAAAGALGSTVPFLLGIQPLDIATGHVALSWGATLGVYMLLWIGAVHFAFVFPHPLPALERWPWIEAALYVVVLGSYGLGALILLAAASGPVAWLAAVNGLQYVVIFVTLAAVVAAGAVQWRRATSADRRMLRGVVAATGFTIVASFLVWFVPELATGRPLIPWSVEGLVGLPVPLALAAAVLRHRAFDIDIIIRRSIVYGGLTAAVIATYAGSVAVLGRFLVGEEGFAVSLLATGVAALVALPVRDLLQRTVDRLLFGDRREPVRAIRRLGKRLEWTLDGDTMPRAVVDTVADALRVPYVALEVGAAESARVVAERGDRHDGALALGLVYGNRPLGRLLVARRQEDEPFSADDTRLLGDLARQVGAALHASLLAEDLLRSRERIVAAREEERRRLRRDLHDGLGPALAAIAMRAEAGVALIRTDPGAAERTLAALGAEVRSAVLDVRRIVDGLRPPAIDELGLVGAITREAERLEAAGHGVRLCVEATDDLPDLPAAVEVAAYRIATEAMTNVIRHAAAHTCTVRLAAADALALDIADDGDGIPPVRRDGLGLISMRERAAELGGACVVEPGPEGGTIVRARLPLHGPPSMTASA